MTKEEWDAHEDILKLWFFADGNAFSRRVKPSFLSYRKIRLFACALQRSIWKYLDDVSELWRRSVHFAELYADDLITPEECLIYQGHVYFDNNHKDLLDMSYRLLDKDGVSMIRNYLPSFFSVTTKHKSEQCDILRDIVEYPVYKIKTSGFAQPVRRELELTKLVICAAQEMYSKNDFSSMGILADLLEDTGFEDVEILSHCRNGLEHFKGCWVVDFLLGKM